MSRGRKRAHDLTALPDELYAFIPESRVLSQLKRLEHHLDATIQRKKTAVQYAFQADTHPQSTRLDLSISHAVTDVGISLHISGSVQDHDLRFGQVVSKVVVQLDSDVFDQPSAQWMKMNDTQEANGMEVKRLFGESGASDSQARILIHLDHSPALFKPMGSLAKVSQSLGISSEAVSSSEVIRTIWHYIQNKGLIDPNDCLYLECDETLAGIFGQPKVLLSELANRIQALLGPCDPISITYDLNLEDPEDSKQKIEVFVEVPPPIDPAFAGWFDSVSSYADEVNQINTQIKHSCLRLHKHKRRYQVLKAFAEAPVDVIQLLIADQVRDARLMNDAEKLKEAKRGSKFYSVEGAWLKKSVDNYLDTLEEN